MTPIYSAPMHTDAYMRKRVNAKMRKCADVLTVSPFCKRIAKWGPAHSRIGGFTLTELIVVLLIISLFLLLAQTNLFGLLRSNTFRAQVQEFVSTMQMAASAAAESDRRYEVIIDLMEQSYMLRQITTPELSEVLEEEIIVENNFGDNCWVAYVLFDDLTGTDEEHQIVKFRAGHSGWQYGGKIVLLDEKEQPYSVVVNRLNRMITLREGDVGLLEPKTKDEVPF
ncbi:MAG: pilus assembly FimT family protein [Planctomycetota bacterium]